MTTPLPPTWDPEHRVLRLSGSSLHDWQACPASWYFSRVLDRQRARGPSTPAQAFGAALHAGLAVLFRGDTSQDTLGRAQAAVLLSHRESGVELGEDWRTPGKAVEVLNRYHKQFVEDNWTPIMLPAGPMVEWRFSYLLGEVGGAQIHWSGFADLGVEFSVGGRVRRSIVDHKFTSRASDFNQTRASYEMDRAIVGYLVSAELLTGLEFDSAMVNEVVVRPDAKTSKLPRFESGEGHRISVSYTSERRSRWRTEVLALASRIVQALDAVDPRAPLASFPQYDTGCRRFNSICQFHGACSLESEADTLSLLSSEEYAPRAFRGVENGEEESEPS